MPMSRPVVDFHWTPMGVPFTYEVDGHVYPDIHQEDGIPRASDDRYIAYSTPLNTLLEFTADVILPTGVVIKEYRWNMGDGTIAYGPHITHTYTVYTPQLAASLVVTDNNGHVANRSKPILIGEDALTPGPLATVLHLDETSGTLAEDSQGPNDGTYGGNVVLGGGGLISDGGKAPTFGT